jgi:drug/metabolite transporter (DMT)-like permease
MSILFACVMYGLVLIISFVASRIIRRLTRRTDIRSGRGFLMVGLGTAVSVYAIFTSFQLHGAPVLSVVASATVGFWCLLAQALVGEREDPSRPTRFFH